MRFLGDMNRPSHYYTVRYLALQIEAAGWLYYDFMDASLTRWIAEKLRFALLDLDGTLLDRYFDDYFWQRLLPELFAKRNGLSFTAARDDLLARFRREEGTLRWTDLDYWSEELGIDIPALKEQTKHLIDVHPHVVPFLSAMRHYGKMTVLVTNAHYKVLDIKLKKTEIGPYLDRVVSSGDLGVPKESPLFWKRLSGSLGKGYERKSLLVDDTEAVLQTARAFGIQHVIFKDRANSALPPKPSSAYPSISSFSELIPEGGREEFY